MLIRPWNTDGQDPDWIADQQAEIDKFITDNPDTAKDKRPTLSLLTKEEIQAELDIYFAKQLNYTVSAFIDEYEYPNLLGTDFNDDEKRAAYFYTLHPPDGYYVDFPNPQYIQIKMFVDPCREKGTSDLCCDGSNENVCEDNTTI